MVTWLDSHKPSFIVIGMLSERPVAAEVQDVSMVVTQSAAAVTNTIRGGAKEVPDGNVFIFRWDTSPAGLIGWPDGISLIWQGKAGSYRSMSEDGRVRTQEET